MIAEYVEQATVTNWPARITWVVGVIVVVLLVLFLMRKGWRNRSKRHADIIAPVWPADLELPSTSVPAMYVGSSRAGDWLDRIVVHGLGVRSRAEVSVVPQGIAIVRAGAPDVFIPAASIRETRTDRAVSATVRSKDSIVLVTWQLGDATLETGLRTDVADDQNVLLTAIESIHSGSAL